MDAGIEIQGDVVNISHHSGERGLRVSSPLLDLTTRALCIVPKRPNQKKIMTAQTADAVTVPMAWKAAMASRFLCR